MFHYSVSVAALLLGISASPVLAQVVSPIVGHFQSVAPASTDSVVSAPLSRPPVHIGPVSSVSGATLAAAGNPGWTPGAFAAAAGSAPYYVRFLDGALAGHALTVMNNSAATLTVDSVGLDLSLVQAGDRIELVPYWTLGTLYPATQAGVAFTASNSALVRGTEILLPDSTRTGINRAPGETYYFFNGAWRKVGASSALSFDRVAIPPDSFILHRNKSTATVVARSGFVAHGALATVFETSATTANDNYVALAYPSDVTLAESNLVGSGAVQSGDLVGVYTPGQTGINRLPGLMFFHDGTAWRRVGANASESFDHYRLPAGEGFVVRKARGAEPVVWTFAAPL